jgi:dihydroorotate dehydrogenase (fumarate)
MLNTKIKNIEFKTPFINASGCWCYTQDELVELNNSTYCNDALISKSSTLKIRDGNPEPRYREFDTLSINSMGLPNYGINYYLDSLTNITDNNKKKFVSLSGLSLDENANMINTIFEYLLLNNGEINGIEINMSCPNVIGKPQVGYDFLEMEMYLDKIFNIINIFEKRLQDKIGFNKSNQLLIGIKLPPYFDISHFETVSKILLKFERLNFITCINSIGNGLVIDTESESVVIKPKNGFGGLGGSIVKPTALANVHKFYQLLGNKIDIIGCGGITNGEDAFQHILAGASMVSIGTELMKRGPQLFNDLQSELIEIMNKKGYKSINDFRGKLNHL